MIELVKEDTHTPSPLMENNSDKNVGISEEEYKSYINKLIEDTISTKAPFRQPKNHVLVVGHDNPQPKHVYFNPHNYRLYLNFDRTTLNIPEPGVNPWSLKTVNSTELLVTNYKGCNLRVKKSQIEITNLIDERWYIIDVSKEGIIQAQYEKIINEKDAQAIQVLKEFMLEFGGNSDCKILRHVSENKNMGEEMIDKLPKEMTFRNDAVKKVYMESNVEFSSPVLSSNYFRNRAIEAIAPEILDSLNALGEAQTKYAKEALEPLTAQIKLHLKVQEATLEAQKETAITMRAIRKDLRLRQKAEATAARVDRIRAIKGAFGW